MMTKNFSGRTYTSFRLRPARAAFIVVLLLASCDGEPDYKVEPLDSIPISVDAADLDMDGFTVPEGDCDDMDAQVHPGAEDLCDRTDQDCDGEVDEDASDSVWYQDHDGDGFGLKTQEVWACAQPEGTVEDATDCHDGNASINPDADEVCNGVDDDCDGDIDGEAAVGQVEWYVDLDDDRYGDPNASIWSCAPVPPGYVEDDSDCDDLDPAANPRSSEVCDGLDNDCDLELDEADALDVLEWWADVDGDGFGDPESSAWTCDPPSGFIADKSDCDDISSEIHPGVNETLDDRLDNNCNGSVDERPGFGMDTGTSSGMVGTADCTDPLVLSNYSDTNTDGTVGIYVQPVVIANNLHSYSSTEFEAAVARANSSFENAGIQFNLLDPMIISISSAFYPIGEDILDAYYLASSTTFESLVIPLFIAEDTIFGADVTGWTYVPPDAPAQNFIVVRADSLSTGVLSHELGHYFGNHHTFRYTDLTGDASTHWLAESASGANCISAGDGNCETPADPGRFDYSNNSGACTVDCSIGTATCGTDPDGNTYTPDVLNLMSYYGCTNDGVLDIVQTAIAACVLEHYYPQLSLARDIDGDGVSSKDDYDECNPKDQQDVDGDEVSLTDGDCDEDFPDAYCDEDWDADEDGDGIQWCVDVDDDEPSTGRCHLVDDDHDGYNSCVDVDDDDAKFTMDLDKDGVNQCDDADDDDKSKSECDIVDVDLDGVYACEDCCDEDDSKTDSCPTTETTPPGSGANPTDPGTGDPGTGDPGTGDPGTGSKLCSRFGTHARWLAGFASDYEDSHGDEVFVADVNGDGGADLVFFDASEGTWEVALSNLQDAFEDGLWTTLSSFGDNCPNSASLHAVLMEDYAVGTGDRAADAILVCDDGNWYACESDGGGTSTGGWADCSSPSSIADFGSLSKATYTKLSPCDQNESDAVETVCGKSPIALTLTEQALGGAVPAMFCDGTWHVWDASKGNVVTKAFCYGDQDSTWDSAFLVDLTGDGSDDMVGFQKDGDWHARLGDDGFDYTNFTSSKYRWGSSMGESAKQVMIGDVNADNMADMVGYYSDGDTADVYDGEWYVTLGEDTNGDGRGDGFSSSWPGDPWAEDFGQKVSGATKAFVADVNADGFDDAIVFYNPLTTSDGSTDGVWHVALSGVYECE